MRILVVEDDRDIAELIGELLQDAGIGVETAASYTSAVALMATGSWDVLLSDMLLPGRHTGLDLAGAAGALGIRVVVMSGSLDRCAEVEARGVRFLAKPFHTAELWAALGCDSGIGNATLAAPLLHAAF